MEDRDWSYEKRQGGRLIIMMGCFVLALMGLCGAFGGLIGYYKCLKIEGIDNIFTRIMDFFL